MHIDTLREKIDDIDNELVCLFAERMNLAKQVAKYKRENNLPIFVPSREQEKLQAVSTAVQPELQEYIRQLYATIFEVSRAYQTECNNQNPDTN